MPSRSPADTAASRATYWCPFDPEADRGVVLATNVGVAVQPAMNAAAMQMIR